MRLLIVDDSNMSRARLRSFLAEMPGLEIFEAASGIEALEMHRSLEPEIIILDVIIPPPDGLATLQILRRLDEQTKIIMSSVLGKQPYVIQECIKHGAFSTLPKPVEKAAAIQAIREAMAAINSSKESPETPAEKPADR